MPFKLSANISMLFHEAGPLVNRYAAAKEAGFEGVEAGFIYDVPAEELAAAREAAGIQQTLINGYPGKTEAGEFGLAALPSRVKDFRDSLDKSIVYAKALKCPRIHILSGCQPSKWKDTAMDETYIENIKYAATVLQKEGLTGLIEPINSFITIPNYYMDSIHKAVDVVKKVNHPNLKLQLDIFHLQLTAGNLTRNIQEFLPYTDYIQIAQAPDRHEPESDGEVNYQYVFKQLTKHNYNGWVGLEFVPSGDSKSCVEWSLHHAH